MLQKSMNALIEPTSMVVLTDQDSPRQPTMSAALARRTTHLALSDLHPRKPVPLTGLGSDQRPDLAWVDVDPERLPEALQYLAQWRPLAAIITRQEPAQQPGLVHQWALEHGCLVVGPGSLGIQRPVRKLNASLHPQLAPAGRVAVITQSRAVMAAVMDWVDDTRTALSAVVCLGDTPTATVDEWLEYFTFDPHTDSIALYLDDVGPARPFISTLRGAARVKPVVVLKSGSYRSGRRADALSPEAVVDAALRRAGALRVRFFLQLFSTLKALSQRPRPRGARLALVANGHGPVDLVRDTLAQQHAMRGATLAPATQQTLRATLSPYATIQNPIIETAPWPAAAFRQTLETLLADPGVDSLLVVLTPEPHNDLEAMVEVLRELIAQRRKPLVVCLMGDATMRRLRERLAQAGIASFRTPETAADSFGQLVRFHTNQQLLLQTQAASPLIPLTQQQAWRPELQALQQAGECAVPDELKLALLQAYDLPLYDGPPLSHPVLAIRIEVLRDPTFGAVLHLRPASPWLAEGSASLELLPLNPFLIRHLLERSPLWRLGLADQAGTPALEQLERQILMLGELAVAYPELHTLSLGPVVITDHGSEILGASLTLAPANTPPLTGAKFAPHLAIAPYPVRWLQEREFADGTPWTLRPIRPEDAEALQRFIRGLSPETRYMRFISTLRELPAPMLARYTQIDYDREVALVATVEQANPEHRNFPQETIIGLAHFLRNSDDGGAEYALVIGDDWQRRGLGSALMQTLLEAASDQDLDYLEGQVLATNRAMLNLMHSLGFKNDPDPEESTLRRVWRQLR